MKKTAIHIVALILVILFGSSAWAQLGPSQPVILCNADASVCGNSIPLGTVTSNQGSPGSQSWRQWLYEPTGGNAMGYFLDTEGKYSLLTYSMIHGPVNNFSGTFATAGITKNNITGDIGFYGLNVFDKDIDAMMESSTDLYGPGPQTCGCFGIYNFSHSLTSSPTYTNTGDNPTVMDLHGGLHVHLYDNSGAEFGLVGNPMYVVVNSITAALPAGTNVIGHVINDASTAVIGHVIVDSGSISFTAPQHVILDSGTLTTVTTVTGITNALPAGTNLLGKVGIDQTTPGMTNGVVPVFLRGAELSDTRTATGDFSFVLDLANYSYFVIQISGGVNGQFFVRCYTDSVNPPGNGYLLSLLRGTINSATSVTSNDIYYVWGTYRYNKCNLQSNSGGTPITVLATPMSGPLPPSPYVSAIIQNTGSNPVPVDNTTAGGAKESGGHLATIDTSTATIGAKTDAANTATDGTSVSIMQVLKEISKMAQAPASTPITPSKPVPANGALTANSATFTTVGATHTSVLASNASRTGLILVNTSNNVISCGIGVNGVLNSGITLVPYGSFTMDAYSYSTQSIDCIASAGSSNLAVQEFQ